MYAIAIRASHHTPAYSVHRSPRYAARFNAGKLFIGSFVMCAPFHRGTRSTVRPFE
jgi:hypothetical protein